MALFGAPEGIHQGVQDLGYMSKAPLENTMLREQISGQALSNQKAKMDLDVRKKMSAALGELGKAGHPRVDNPADLVDTMGALWMQAGDPSKAMAAYSSASMMRNHEANTQAAAARQRYEDIRTHEKILTDEIGQLQGVSNQQELDALTTRMKQVYPNARIPWEGMAYSPELKDKIGTTLLTASQRLRLRQSEDKLNWQKQYQSSLLALKEANLRLSKSREKRMASAAKAREGKVSEPTHAQVNLAAAQIRMAHPSFNTAPADMQDNLATIVAEKAREKMAQNKALRFSEASQQAMADPEIRQDLKAIADAEFNGKIWNSVRGMVPPENEQPSQMAGVTSANPLPYSTDPNSYEEGNWYFDGNGKPMFYMNGTFYAPDELDQIK